MKFDEVVRQAAKLLQQQSRLTYQTLERQFALDDDALADLKDELLFSHLVVDKDGRGLVWEGAATAPESDAQRGAAAELRLHALLPVVTLLFQREFRAAHGADGGSPGRVCHALGGGAAVGGLGTGSTPLLDGIVARFGGRRQHFHGKFSRRLTQGSMRLGQAEFHALASPLALH